MACLLPITILYRVVLTGGLLTHPSDNYCTSTEQYESGDEDGSSDGSNYVFVFHRVKDEEYAVEKGYPIALPGPFIFPSER